MSKFDGCNKTDRLWRYTERAAIWLRDNGFPDDDGWLKDWLKEMDKLIFDARDKDSKDAKDQRVDPVVQAIDDAIELLEMYIDPQFAIWDEQDKKSLNLGVIALRYMKGSLYEK